MAKVLAKAKHQNAAAAPTPVLAAPVAAPKATLVQKASKASSKQTADAEAKASQEKVKEMAQKLGIPFTTDLMNLGSNSDISDSLIEKAVAAGKSEAEINNAMASL